MNWIVAILIGFAVGLASFGVLWLTVRRSMLRANGGTVLILSSLVRLFVIGMVFCALSHQGIGNVVSALAGLWLARWILVGRFAGAGHAR